MAGLAAGAAAAAILVFALSPLQHAARRVADRAVPAGRAQFPSLREKNGFYRKQLLIAYSDGAIGAKERVSLRSIRERLGIPADLAVKLEDEVACAARRRAASPSPG